MLRPCGPSLPVTGFYNCKSIAFLAHRRNFPHPAQSSTIVDTIAYVNYGSHMLEIRKTAIFAKWIANLKDRKAKARIQARIDRVELGHFGDVASVGDGVNELRIFYGPGYRVYFIQRNMVVVILLSGGDKGSQQADIAKAKEIARQLEV